jgi:hypothetical protein
MYFRELTILTLPEIYQMMDGEYKKDELIKALLIQEHNRIKDIDPKNAEFIRGMIQDMVTDSNSITGNNPDL